MRSTLLTMSLAFALLSSAYGWGYLFSRFRPEASNNWGSYGGAGLQNQPEHLTPREQLMEAIIGEELLEEEVCTGRRCTSNEHCCPAHVCVDYDRASGSSCMPVEAAQREAADCSSDLDCGDGRLCEMGTCAPLAQKKGYTEPCMVSSECDFGRGLCCQVIRRHRQAPRKMCSYFKDPLSCIGHMETEKRAGRPGQ